MASIGQGSISFSQKQTGGGPPFAANAANNGLSVDSMSGKIVLGQNVGAVGNPGVFLNNREIPTQGLDFTIGDINNVGSGIRIFFDETLDNWSVGTSLSNTFFFTNPANRRTRIGDTFGGNQSSFEIDDLGGTMIANAFGKSVLILDFQNSIYTIGDDGGVGNQTRMIINDAGSTITAEATNGFIIQGSSTLIQSLTTLFNGAAAAVGTLNNAPVAGNPTKWIRIIDNGVTRFIPAW